MEKKKTNTEETSQEEKKSRTKKKLTQEDILKFLDTCYEKSLSGIKVVSPPIDKFADEYIKKHKDPEKAAKAMIKNQIAKCTTSGFIAGFGGAITLPVTIPANIGSVLYVQIRMIACTAYLAGLDLNSDQVQTFVYACLAGVSVNEVVKQAGIKIGVKMAEKAIEKIPGKALIKINQKIGFRLITKFGEKGVVNLGKLLPGVGAVINGGLDFAETKIIANRAYKMFFEGDYSAGEDLDTSIENSQSKNDDIIDVEVVDGVAYEEKTNND
jgi:hypothetical protein